MAKYFDTLEKLTGKVVFSGYFDIISFDYTFP